MGRGNFGGTWATHTRSAAPEEQDVCTPGEKKGKRRRKWRVWSEKCCVGSKELAGLELEILRCIEGFDGARAHCPDALGSASSRLNAYIDRSFNELY